MPVPASPRGAKAWLVAWSSIGGGVTINLAGRVCPWRVRAPGATPQERAAADFLQTDLLRRLDRSPGLEAAVRIIISTEARKVASRSVATMLRAS
jgi:hypothetical protein